MSDDLKIKLSDSWPRSSWRVIEPDESKPVRELYHKGRFFDAFELSKEIAPLQAWSGGSARPFAGDLAGFLGGYRLSDWLDVTAWRSAPKEESAILNFARCLRSRRGPIRAWWFLNEHPVTSTHSNFFKFDWHTQRAGIALHFRDFSRAKAFAETARAFCERPVLIPMAECYRLRAEDKLDAALEKAREAYAINPSHVSAQRNIVEILLAKNQDQECFSFLAGALEKTQDAYLVSLKVRLLIEREEFPEALEGLSLYERWAPLCEADGDQWLSTRRCDAYYHLERFDEAIEWAEKVGSDYYTAFAARLKEERKRKWVRLPVGFIRQDHNTCGPATLTALANFWGLPADHGQVAENVGFDGSYDFEERRWVEGNGFYVREFKVTWESAERLINRGIPFAMVTSWPGGAHLQAVIGYDSVWRTLLIRDPGVRDIGEFDWKKTEEMYRAVGPRGMALVPIAQKQTLAELDLPETELYDATYQISLALDRHAREDARRVLADLEKRLPGERMTIQGRRLIADYDNNSPESMVCIERLLELFPNDERLSLSLLSCLRDLGRRDDRLALLRKVTAKRDCHALMWKELAAELYDDSRMQAETLKLLQRAHSKMPWQTNTISRIADVLWNQGRFDEATDIYRFAACADNKKEAPSRSFFIATRRVRRTDEAIAFLRERFAEYGPRAFDSVRTLFYALEQLDRMPEAFAELARAIDLRPKDGELLCYAAETYRRYGKKAEAYKYLAQAESESPRANWLRTAGQLAEGGGELDEALERWKEVARLQPLARDAHGEVAELLSKTRGRQAAIAYLRGIYERFPHNLDVGKLLLDWIKNEDLHEAISLCRALFASHPTDAWVARELAIRLSRVPAHLEESLKYAELGRDLDPASPSAYNVLGDIWRKMGKTDDARETFRQAIRRQVDDTFAIEHLINLGATQEEKRQDLLFVRTELERQVVFGEGLVEFRSQAERALPAKEALGYLEEARAARPDLWHAWAAVIEQFVHMGRFDEALSIALETSRKFAMIAGSWRELGKTYEHLDRWQDAVKAFQRAVEISPEWISAIANLSEAHRRNGDWSRARQVLVEALRHTPTSDVLHGYLAELEHLEGHDPEAINHIKQALGLNPHYDWGWEKLNGWAEHDEVVKLCREFTRKRPGIAESWLRLADNLDPVDDFVEVVDALNRAIGLQPQNEGTYDLKAYTLARNKRFDEALAACRPPTWMNFTPLRLRGRAAWIENERGNRNAAITIMKAVVADDSSYYWGWERLSDWLLVENKTPEAVRAAEHLVRLRPGAAQAFGFCADARLRLGNRYGAIEDLRRAHILDPDYGYATWTLFDLLLDDEDYGEAEKLLVDARRYAGAAKVSAAEIRIALCCGKNETAGELLKAFGASPDGTVDAFKGIEKQFEEQSALALFDSSLEELVTAREASGPVLSVWARRSVQAGRKGIAKHLDRYLKQSPAVGRIGANGYYNQLGVIDRFPREALSLLRRHEGALRENTHTWGLVGYALNCGEKFAHCARWLNDWRERQGLERWMLVNLTQALRNLSRESESTEINRRILELEPANVFGNLYLGFDLALAGDVVAVRKHLDAVDEKNLKDDLRLYYRLIEELLQAANVSERSNTIFLSANSRIQAHFLKLKNPSWQFIRAYNLTIARLARLNGCHASAIQCGLSTSPVARICWQVRTLLKSKRQI